ncbi:hypothetical protein KKD04_02810 [Patescibacteria group bacterium]|nr:hypothetical protein [Patescibacteria group bacterium]
MNNEKAQGQVWEFGAAVLKALPRSIDANVMQGWIEDPKNLQDVLKKALCPPENNQWRERDGVIYFFVTSDNTTGPDWIKRLESKGFQVSKWAKDLLRSPDFKPTSGVTTEIAVLKGILFSDNDRITKKIRAEAEKINLSKPNAETACLIRERFSDKEIEEMGLYWIVTMHEPIKDSDGGPDLLSVLRDDRWLDADYGHPDHRWDHVHGFAFVVSQVF